MNTGTKLLNALFFTVSFALAISPVHAALEGEQVVNGQVSFDRSTLGKTIINASDRNIINYNRFDILPSETVRFIQPSKQASVLNRVTGNTNPSRIMGNLIANGQVVLVNPAGIMFGENAIVDVGSLIAAAGQIADRDYINGINRFTDLTGFIENYGKLSAVDTIHLIGANVLNAGEIHAPDGMVSMRVGDELYLGQEGSQLFVNLGSQGVATETTGATDAGERPGFLGVGDMYSLAIRNRGLVEAKAITLDASDDGVVSLEGGTLDASNRNSREVGGSIKVLGKRIGVFAGTKIDASGDAGGGKINIGGGFQGSDPALRNARLTYVAEGVTIRADALNKGDGGDVIVWADGLTLFDGFISARGGAQRGDGGFAEVSGKGALQWLDHASADLSAVAGNNGDLLLDPDTITIVEDVGDADINGDGIADEIDDITSIEDLDEITDFPNVDSIISNDAIDSLLSSETAGDLTLFADTRITVNAPINENQEAVHSLTFKTQQLEINETISFPRFASFGASFEPADVDSPIVVTINANSNINIFGSNVDDTVTIADGVSLSGSGTIRTLAGDDTVTIGEGAFSDFNVLTGAGDDVVTLQEGASLSDLWTDEGNDTVTIASGASIDVYLDTDEGDDRVTIASGGAVWSDSGSDYFSTGPGNDTVILNEGAITIDFETGDGDDEVRILGGNGNGDGDSSATSFNYLDTGDGDDTVLLTGRLSGFDGESSESVESPGYASIYTGNDNDTVEFSGTTFFIGDVYTEEGNDTVEFSGDTGLGFEGEGVVDTGGGDDIITINESASIFGTLQTGPLFLGDSSESDDDAVTITGGDMHSEASTFLDTLNTGDGDDTVSIVGQVFANAPIDTGSGDDFVQFSGAIEFAGDVETGSGNDTVEFSGGETRLGFEGEGQGVIDTGGGDDTIRFLDSGSLYGLEINGGDFRQTDGGVIDSGFDTLDFRASSLATAVDPGGEGPVIIYDEETSGVTIPDTVIINGYSNINRVLLPSATVTLITSATFIPPAIQEDHEEELEPVLERESFLAFNPFEDYIEDALIEELAKLGIYARNNTLEENLQRFRGSAEFVQRIKTDQPSMVDFKVAVGRTEKMRILKVLESYYELIGFAGMEPIRKNLQQVVEDYHKDSDAMTGEGLRAYIEERQDDELYIEALGYLNGYRKLFTRIETTGLTPREIEISKFVLLRGVRVRQFSHKDLYEAIQADFELEL